MIQEVTEIVGKDYILTEPDQMVSYLYDETEIHVRPQPASDCIVVKPETTEQVSELLKLANQYKIPVIPRGGGTGATGAAIPTEPSLILSMERLNRILEVDTKNMMITVETGVSLGQMNEYLLKNHKDLYFPIHPGDESAHIGGMAIENAGGAKAVKHGIMRNHVKGMEVVYPTGEISMVGGKIVKNNMGYDLLHFIIGSEGTLAVATKVILKLYPRTGYSATLVVSFMENQAAIDSVNQILETGIVPLAIEYMQRELVLETAKHMNMVWPAKNNGRVDIMFVLEGDSEETLYAQAESMVEICDRNQAVDTILADNYKDEKLILDIRSNIYTAYKELFVDSLDTCVPPHRAGELIEEFDAIAAEYGTTCPIMGHLGDGNFHNFIMLVDGKVPDYVDELRGRYYQTAIKYGGTISAEHGTGKTRKKYMHQQFSEFEIELMQKIKRAFDPNWILCPGTILDRPIEKRESE